MLKRSLVAIFSGEEVLLSASSLNFSLPAIKRSPKHFRSSYELFTLSVAENLFGEGNELQALQAPQALQALQIGLYLFGYELGIRFCVELH